MEGPQHLMLQVGDLPSEPLGIIRRTAVRAVIQSGDRLLLVHSSVGGDYKFPGGGVEAGESSSDALAREVREECGRTLTSVGPTALVVSESRPAIEPGWVLAMTSSYVECAVGDAIVTADLDDYEQALGLRPEWVPIVEALEVNKELVASGRSRPWVPREVLALEALRPRLG